MKTKSFEEIGADALLSMPTQVFAENGRTLSRLPPYVGVKQGSVLFAKTIGYNILQMSGLMMEAIVSCSPIHILAIGCSMGNLADLGYCAAAFYWDPDEPDKQAPSGGPSKALQLLRKSAKKSQPLPLP